MTERMKETELECPICLDGISESDPSYATTAPCNHFYHSDCILLWTKLSASTCPQCRTELSAVNVVNESKTIKIEHKKADTLIGMIVQSSSTSDIHANATSHTSSSATTAAAALNRPRIVTTEGLVNVLVSTPENATRHQHRSLYERMIEATSNPLFDEYGDDDIYNDDASSGGRRSGSLFRRRERTTHAGSDGDNARSRLSNQQCCICDTSVLISQVIVCPQCSALYHRSCCDGLNCPLCEEWIDDVQSPSIACLPKRSRSRGTRGTRTGNESSRRLRGSNRAPLDDSSYYVELVNELQRRSNNTGAANATSSSSSAGLNFSPNSTQQTQKAESASEKEAWEALNLIQQSSNNNNEETLDNKDIPPSHDIPESDTQPLERKLKRPKRSISKTMKPVPTLLTESALAHLDSRNEDSSTSQSKSRLSRNRSKSDMSSKPKCLSFTQKLIVQRLLLKPRLNKDLANKLTFESYTELNKHISHKLYSYVQQNQLAISSMNAVIELAEREGFLPFVNRKSVDNFNSSCNSNPIIKRFVDCEWHKDDDSFTRQVQNIINTEVQKWVSL